MSAPFRLRHAMSRNYYCPPMKIARRASAGHYGKSGTTRRCRTATLLFIKWFLMRTEQVAMASILLTRSCVLNPMERIMRSAALATLLCAGLAFGLAGCQRESGTSTSSNAPPVVTPKSSTSAPTPPPSSSPPSSANSPASPGTSSSMGTAEPPKAGK